ncbi:MAG: IS1595 family transposase [Taibaiella sp.]|nr:IS1595 family transposase [Taibaiella sp.]
MALTDKILSFNTLLQVSEYFSDQQNCIDFIKEVRWNGELKCAHCGHDKVYTLNGKNKRYKCAGCKKQFTIIKGTIFENSPIPLKKWFITIYLLVTRKKGISSIQLSKDIGVTQKTAWFMLHRIRFMLRDSIIENKLKGIIQLDETFVGGKNKNRHWDKKVKNSQGRSFKDKTPVFGMLEQEESYYIERPHKVIEGRTVREKVVTKRKTLRCKVVKNTRAKTLKPIIYQSVERGCTIVTDEWQAYNGLNGIYEHYIVNHKEKQYATDGYSSNGVENVWSHFKRAIIGVYHNVSRKHLHRYVSEFEFRYNNHLLKGEELMQTAFVNFERRLTWRQLLRRE